MNTGVRFRREAERRIEGFYREFASLGEVSPAARFRLEGFLETGIVLELIDRRQLQGLIDESYQRHLGHAPGRVDAASDALWLPLYWSRAPVFPG